MFFFFNRLILARDYFFKRKKVNAFPTEVVLELTNHCNLKCITCPHPIMVRPKGFMDLELAKKIIETCSSWAELIDFDMFGESQMHPHFFEIVQFAKNKKIKTLLNTNLTWQSEEQLQALAKNGPDLLVVSVDGATKKNYESIRIGGDWQKLMKNIDYLVSCNPCSHIVIQMVVSTLNLNQIKKFKTMWKSKNISFRLHPYEVLLPGKNDILIMKKSERPKSHCIMPWRKFVIAWDGSVVPCCADFDKSYVLGDMNFESITEVWNGKKMTYFRGEHVKGEENVRNQFDLCRDCDWFVPSRSILFGSIFVSTSFSKKILHKIENYLVSRI